MQIRIPLFVLSAAMAALLCHTGSAQDSLEDYGGGYEGDGTNLPLIEDSTPSQYSYSSSLATARGAGWGAVASRLEHSRLSSAPSWLADRARNNRDRDDEVIVIYEPRYRYYDPAPRVRYSPLWAPPHRYCSGPGLHFSVGWGRHGGPSWRLSLGGHSGPWPMFGHWCW